MNFQILRGSQRARYYSLTKDRQPLCFIHIFEEDL
jgi:hypothetical protein